MGYQVFKRPYCARKGVLIWNSFMGPTGSYCPTMELCGETDRTEPNNSKNLKSNNPSRWYFCKIRPQRKVPRIQDGLRTLPERLWTQQAKCPEPEKGASQQVTITIASKPQTFLLSSYLLNQVGFWNNLQPTTASSLQQAGACSALEAQPPAGCPRLRRSSREMVVPVCPGRPGRPEARAPYPKSRQAAAKHWNLG